MSVIFIFGTFTVILSVPVNWNFSLALYYSFDAVIGKRKEKYVLIFFHSLIFFEMHR